MWSVGMFWFQMSWMSYRFVAYCVLSPLRRSSSNGLDISLAELHRWDRGCGWRKTGKGTLIRAQGFQADLRLTPPFLPLSSPYIHSTRSKVLAAYPIKYSTVRGEHRSASHSCPSNSTTHLLVVNAVRGRWQAGEARESHWQIRIANAIPCRESAALPRGPVLPLTKPLCNKVTEAPDPWPPNALRFSRPLEVEPGSCSNMGTLIMLVMSLAQLLLSVNDLR